MDGAVPEPVFHAEADDPALEESSRSARQTFPYFWRELSWEYRRIVPAHDTACVKFAFGEPGQVEHMWANQVDFDGVNVKGVLLNEPNKGAGVHRGDRIDRPLAVLDDWLLAKNKTVFGAFTVRCMRSRMSAKERKKHDAAWGLPFGDAREVPLPYPGDDHPMALNVETDFDGSFTADPSLLRMTDDRGFTLLHREALAGNANIVALLLRHGADPRCLTPDGRTPAALARALGWTRIEALFAEALAKGARGGDLG